MPLTSRYLWFHRGSIAACLAETVTLALDESAECLSLGRNLDPMRIEAIGHRAEAHGFSFARLFSFGLPLDDSALAAYRKTLARRIGPRRLPREPAQGAGDRNGQAPAEQPGLRAIERFRRRVGRAVGGGSLACAAGLAAVRVFRETDVVANADARGRQLLDGLQQLAARYRIVREARGQGLLLGLEFNPPPASILGLLQGLLAGGASTFLVPGIEDIQRSLTATYVMTLLLQEYVRDLYASGPIQSPRAPRRAAADAQHGGSGRVSPGHRQVLPRGRIGLFDV